MSVQKLSKEEKEEIRNYIKENPNGTYADFRSKHPAAVTVSDEKFEALKEKKSRTKRISKVSVDGVKYTVLCRYSGLETKYVNMISSLIEVINKICETKFEIIKYAGEEPVIEVRMAE